MDSNEFLGSPDDVRARAIEFLGREFLGRAIDIERGVTGTEGVNVPFGARGKCHKCACPYFSGSGWVCDRGGCHHH